MLINVLLCFIEGTLTTAHMISGLLYSLLKSFGKPWAPTDTFNSKGPEVRYATMLKWIEYRLHMCIYVYM